jgi:hypothetical protein
MQAFDRSSSDPYPSISKIESECATEKLPIDRLMSRMGMLLVRLYSYERPACTDLRRRHIEC